MARIDAVWSVATGLSQIDLVTAAAFQAQNLLLSLRAGEPYSRGHEPWRSRRSAAPSRARGDDSASRPSWPRRAASPRAFRSRTRLGMVALADGIAALSCGRWDEGDAQRWPNAEATFRTECVGVIWELATLHHFRVWTFAFRGAYAEMMSYGHDVLDEARAAKRPLHSRDDWDVRRADRAAARRRSRSAHGTPSKKWRGAGRIGVSACSG